jgi:hypothetical protein
VRHLLHANYGDVASEVVPVPRGVSHEYFAELMASLGDRLSTVRAVAGQSANYLLPVLEGRPVAAFTVVREPVDRVLSRYYFMSPVPDWTLADLYAGRLRRIPAYFNGQARALLEPLGDTRDIPLRGASPLPTSGGRVWPGPSSPTRSLAPRTACRRPSRHWPLCPTSTGG